MNSLIEMPDDACIGSYKNGFKLLSGTAKISSLSIAQLLNLPHCVYFSNLKSETQLINKVALDACGYISKKEALGKTIEYVATPETSKRVISSHREVMNYQKLHLVEDDVIRKDNFNFQALSILRPWYKEDDNSLIGIVGISVMLNNWDIVKVINTLVSFGLLNNKPISKNRAAKFASGFVLNGIYLSRRETQCVKYYIRGRTVKNIANLLQLSPRTIEHYLENIKNKIGVSSRSELISYIIEHTEAE